MGKINSVEYQISLKDLLSSTLKKAEGNVKDFESEVDKAVYSIGSLNNAMINSHAGSFMQTTGAVAIGSLLTRGIEMAGQAAVSQVKSILAAGLDAGKIRAEFGVLTGGKEMGDALFGDLNKYIAESVFGPELFQNAKTMMSMGIATREVIPTMKMLGDVAMGDAEKMKSLALAYSQVISLGRLQGDNLRQMAEGAGFNPLQVLSEKTGKSMAYYRDQMERGNISAAMMKEAFRIATSEGGKFFGMLDKIGETPFGKLQAMQGNIDMAKQQLGESLLPAMSDFMTASKPLIDELPAMFAALKPTIDGVIGGFTNLATWVSHNGDTVTALAKGVKLLIEGYLVWKAGTVAITAVNWLWTASITGQTAATARSTAAAVAENAALVTQAEIVAALTLEYEALTASIAGMTAAETLLMRQTAAASFNLPIAMGGVAARTATTGAGALVGGIGAAILPVTVAYFGGEAVAQMIAANPFTGEDWSLKSILKASAPGSADAPALGISVLKTIGIDPIGDAIANKIGNATMPAKALSENKWWEYKKPDNPFFPNVKTAATKSSASSTTDPLKSDISKVTGQQVKNIYVTINGGLVHAFTVNTTNLKESRGAIKRVVTEALADSINDSQLNN